MSANELKTERQKFKHNLEVLGSRKNRYIATILRSTGYALGSVIVYTVIIALIIAIRELLKVL